MNKKLAKAKRKAYLYFRQLRNQKPFNTPLPDVYKRLPSPNVACYVYDNDYEAIVHVRIDAPCAIMIDREVRLHHVIPKMTNSSVADYISEHISRSITDSIVGDFQKQIKSKVETSISDYYKEKKS
jgi:hypothetical protein